MTYTQEQRKEYMRRWRALNGGDYPRRKQMREKRSAHGLCWRCGVNRRTYRKMCNACLSLCGHCPEVKLPDRAFCARHADSVRRKKAKQIRVKRAAGICFRCPEKALAGGICRTHHMKTASHNNLGTARFWLELDQMYESQSRLCFWCGRTTELGVNAQVDHKLPRLRFPDYARRIDNLVWACQECNYAKRDRTPAEFVLLCGLVVSRASELLK